MPLEEFAPEWDVRSRHAIPVDAPPEIVYRSLRSTNFADSALTRGLLALRGLGIPRRNGTHPEDPAAVQAKAIAERLTERRITIDTAVKNGFVVLSDRPGEELVLGTVGNFWSLRPRSRKLTRQKFRQFAEPGAAKAAWAFTITPRPDGGSVLTTETRVVCADAADRARFRLYWLAVGPFSGMIRRSMLAMIRERAESLAKYRIYTSI